MYSATTSEPSVRATSSAISHSSRWISSER